MKYLVTGGSGFIGSNLVDRLIDLGHDVVVIDNESSTTTETYYTNDKAKYYFADITDYFKLKELYSGVDCVFHFAGQSSIRASMGHTVKTAYSDIYGTSVVLQCAKDNNVKKFVYASSGSVYGNNKLPHTETQVEDCLNLYSTSKIAGEELCKSYYKMFGIETIILRYFNVYGERQSKNGEFPSLFGTFEKQKEKQRPLTIFNNGEQKRDFINISDAIDATIIASTITIPKEYIATPFNIGYGKNYSVKEIAKMYKHYSINLEKENIPIYFSESDAKESLASIEKSKKVFGWRPKISLEEWMNKKNG
jgi:UDP-glucose 4-epimerase